MFRNPIILTACLFFLPGTLCDAAILKLNGLSKDKKEQLLAELSPRLEFIKTRPPAPWRADDTSFFLKRLLIRDGYADAEVDWKLPGGQIILINARPGPRYLYGRIHADRLGPLEQGELENYFLQPIVETEIVEAEQAPYIAEYSPRGAANVENYLKSQGYWKAVVAISSEVTDRTKHRANIKLGIKEGKQHRIAKPKFPGAQPENVNSFSPNITPYIGMAANTKNITSIRNVVENYYSTHGYQLAKISMTSEHDGSLTHLIFNIEKGHRYRLGTITVTGNNKTSTRRIKRYFNSLRKGDYNQNLANASLNKLLATGAFSHATLSTTPLPNRLLNILLEVREGKAKTVRNYLGMGSYEGFIIGSSYTDHNFRGSLRRLNLRGEYSGRGLLGEIALSEPQFAGEPIQLNTRAFLLQRQNDGYDKNEAGLEASFIWSPKKEFSSRIYLGTSYVSTSSGSLTAAELGPKDYLHTRIGAEQTIDFRDSAILPTEGFYTRALLEFGTLGGDSSSSYFHADFQSSYRIRLGEKNSILARFATGAIKPSTENNLPIDLRLFNGGSNSVRSFKERDLGPLSLSNDPLGGQAYWHAAAEYIHTIRDPVKGIVFIDMGQVYDDFDNWGFSDPSYAAGIGLRVDIPIGSIRLEYGYNLNRQPGEPSGTFHFAIGTSF